MQLLGKSVWRVLKELELPNDPAAWLLGYRPITEGLSHPYYIHVIEERVGDLTETH